MATNNASKELIVMTIIFRYFNIKDLIDEIIILIVIVRGSFIIVLSRGSLIHSLFHLFIFTAE